MSEQIKARHMQLGVSLRRLAPHFRAITFHRSDPWRLLSRLTFSAHLKTCRYNSKLHVCLRFQHGVTNNTVCASRRHKVRVFFLCSNDMNDAILKYRRDIHQVTDYCILFGLRRNRCMV